MATNQAPLFFSLLKLAQVWRISPRVLALILLIVFKVVLMFLCQFILACLGYDKVKTVGDTSIDELYTFGSVFPFLTPQNYVELAREFKGLTPHQVNMLIHKLEPSDRTDFETTQAALEKLDPGTLARYRSETSETIYANRRKKTIVTVLYWMAVAFVFIYLLMNFYLKGVSPVLGHPH